MMNIYVEWSFKTRSIWVCRRFFSVIVYHQLKPSAHHNLNNHEVSCVFLILLSPLLCVILTTSIVCRQVGDLLTSGESRANNLPEVVQIDARHCINNTVYGTQINSYRSDERVPIIKKKKETPREMRSTGTQTDKSFAESQKDLGSTAARDPFVGGVIGGLVGGVVGGLVVLSVLCKYKSDSFASTFFILINY